MLVFALLLVHSVVKDFKTITLRLVGSFWHIDYRASWEEGVNNYVSSSNLLRVIGLDNNTQALN